MLWLCILGILFKVEYQIAITDLINVVAVHLEIYIWFLQLLGFEFLGISYNESDLFQVHGECQTSHLTDNRGQGTNRQLFSESNRVNMNMVIFQLWKLKTI